jgi:competence protein J (ComJ)
MQIHCIDRSPNDWTDDHVRQGFSWRAGSVSFETELEWGIIDVDAVLVNEWQPLADATRVVCVPFDVRPAIPIVVSSTDTAPADEIKLTVPPGQYCLYFEHGIHGENRMWARFSFAPSICRAEILRMTKPVPWTQPPELVMKARGIDEARLNPDRE